MGNMEEIRLPGLLGEKTIVYLGSFMDLEDIKILCLGAI
jgi:hypothetical protein